MSDFTSDSGFRPRRAGERGPEYWAYFAPVLALSLPLAALRAGRAVLTSDAVGRPGIVRDAICRAHEVTATICSV